MRICKQLSGFIGDQLIPKIIFVLKIQIERSLCQTGLIYNIRDGCVGKTLFRKQIKCRLEEGILFLFFVYLQFSHGFLTFHMR